MTAEVEVKRETRDFGAIGGRRISFTCGCGFRTDWVSEGTSARELLRRTDQPFAEGQMRAHLEDAHLEEIGMGHCSECGAVTDYLSVVLADGGRGWLCVRCGPTPTEFKQIAELPQ